MAQTHQAVYLGEGESIDYTAGSAVASGDVVVQGSLPGFVRNPIAASTLGSLGTTGLWRVVKANGAITAGAAVYWDADGSPQGGTALSGAATTTAPATHSWASRPSPRARPTRRLTCSARGT
jgi:predicted RecA/RadA family phage recombinase